MDTASRKISLGEIARQAGVSRMTVSCALRNVGRVKPETAVRIGEIARSLGYSPDPRMAMTMSRVRDAKKKELLPLAWLHASENGRAYHDYKWLSPYMEGAKERCDELGYKLDELWLGAPGMTEGRMSSIIVNRGIRGVIVSPSIPELRRLRLDWRKFASVSFETAMLSPGLHRAVPDYYHNITLALKMLRRSGYRRIGLCVQLLEARRSHHTYLGSLHYFQSAIPDAERVRPLVCNPLAAEELKAWVNREKPDAVIAHHSRIIEWLGSAGLRVPEDIGVAHLALDDDCADWAGIWQHKRRIGAQAVEQVVSMIHNNRTGVPDVAYETLIPGEWRFGWTLRKRK
ncbi:LacI family transcriptional regulator [Opitutaceae bacterium TAV5]|nr:LacI family transcriptional regulator [Opitutaceae bacterium TAV5]